VRHRRAIQAEPVGRLPEVPPHHVLELVEVHHRVRVERVDIDVTRQWTEARALFSAAPLANYEESVLA
jgi:hypothetical protein